MPSHIEKFYKSFKEKCKTGRRPNRSEILATRNLRLLITLQGLVGKSQDVQIHESKLCLYPFNLSSCLSVCIPICFVDCKVHKKAKYLDSDDFRLAVKSFSVIQWMTRIVHKTEDEQRSPNHLVMLQSDPQPSRYDASKVASVL